MTAHHRFVHQPPELFTDEDERVTVMRAVEGVICAMIFTAAIVGVCAAIWAWFG